jgi:hypothetical protein
MLINELLTGCAETTGSNERAVRVPSAARI